MDHSKTVMKILIFKRTITLKIVAALVLSVIFSTLGYSKQFKQISNMDGLSGNTVFAVEVDRDQFVWFGTDYGVDRYDGKEFKRYLKNGAMVLDIYNDSNNNLWIATSKGLYLYNNLKDQFEHIKALGGVRLIAITEYDKFLVTNTNNTIYVLDRETLEHKEFKFLDPKWLFVEQSQDGVIIGSGSGVSELKLNKVEDKNLVTMVHKLPILNDKNITYIKRDDDRFIIFTLNSGVYSYDSKAKTVDAIDNLSMIKGVRTRSVTRFNDHYLIGIDGVGVIETDSDFNVIEIDSHSEDVESSISDNGIYDILIDCNKNIWISTFNGGVNIYNPSSLEFKSFTHIRKNSRSLGNNIGRACKEVKPGVIWFGTRRGISIYNTQKNSWKHLTESEGDLSSDIVLDIEVVNDQVWVGTYQGGIACFNLDGDKLSTPKILKDHLESIGANHIYSIFADQDRDRVWIGVLRGDLISYSLSKRDITNYPIKNVQVSYQGASGNLYFGAKDGFYIIRKLDSSIERYKEGDGDDTINNGRVVAFCETDSTHLFLGTEGGGLTVFDLDKRDFKVYQEEDGLPSNIVNGILKGGDDIIWLSTYNGLSIFNQATNKFINIGLSDNLPIKEFKYGCSTEMVDGSFIFGGVNGFISFNPSELYQQVINRVSKPKLVFNDLMIANRVVDIDDESSPIKQQLNSLDQIYLKDNQNTFAISFTGINFNDHSNNRYSWKLEPFETEWSPDSKFSNSSYTNIPYGDYKFKVRVRDIGSGWNDEIRSIDIHIATPIWQTIWAYILYLVVLAVVVVLVVRYVRAVMHDKSSTDKIQFFINVAHDLKTPLTLIKSPISSVIEHNNIGERDREMLDMAIVNVEKMENNVHQLLDFQKAEMKKLILQVEEHNIVDQLTDICLTFEPLMVRKKINFKMMSDGDNISLFYDKNKMEKVFNNLISNSYKYSNLDGEIDIQIKRDNKYCIIEFNDKGIGIPADQHKSIFNRYYRATNAINTDETGSGVGLLLVKHIVNLHKGDISFTSREGEGSSFVVKLKLGRKHYADEQLADGVDSNRYIPVYSSDNSEELNGDMSELETEVYVESRDTILFVEDSVDLRTFLAKEFSGNYNILTASNGKEALDQIEKCEPNIVVSDVMMAEMDGHVLCKTLKQDIATSHIPIILVTALTSPNYKVEGYELGADGYIEKPFDLRILKSKIENLLKYSSMLKSKFTDGKSEDDTIVYKNDLDQKFIEKCIEVLNNHMDNSEFSVEVFSSELCMSRPVLYRKLKSLTGQSPQDFIKVLRLKHAAKLIREGGVLISEIAYLSGFSDPKYFSTSFKKFFGVSPSKY